MVAHARCWGSTPGQPRLEALSTEEGGAIHEQEQEIIEQAVAGRAGALGLESARVLHLANQYTSIEETSLLTSTCEHFNCGVTVPPDGAETLKQNELC